jgi:hypothetical protein
MHGRSRDSLDFFSRPSLRTQTAALTMFCPASDYKRPAARIQDNTGIESATRPILVCWWAWTIRATTYAIRTAYVIRLPLGGYRRRQALTQSRVRFQRKSDFAPVQTATERGVMSDRATNFTGSIPQFYDHGLGPVFCTDFADDIVRRAAALAPILSL